MHKSRGGASPEEEQTKQDTRKDTVHIGSETTASRDKIMELLSDFGDMWSGQLGNISAVRHRIGLTSDAKPVYQVAYRAGHRARDVEKREIDRMERAKVIERAASEWRSPVVLIPKKDGEMPFCVDYRKLNAVTKRDSYPLPRMDECIDSLGNAAIFTTLDCNSGYWQIEIDEADRDKTTFTSHCGLYRFVQMPFGLQDAPATFQRAVDIILSRVKGQHALVYLDDVGVCSTTVEAHFEHVREVLTRVDDERTVDVNREHT